MLRASLAALALTGCYSPRYEDCQFSCSSANTCPTGMECVQGTCRIEGQTGSCGNDDAGADGSTARWSDPVDIGQPIGFSDPSITEDGTELFTSDASGMLFVSVLQGGAFGLPMPIVLLNSSFTSNPQISADGLTLYFSSTRPGGAGGNDIWQSTRATRSSPWMPPANVTPLNTTTDDTGGATTADARFMVLASNHGTPRVDVFASTFNASSNSWLAPVQIPGINNTLSNTAHPCLDGTGTKLVFASDRTGDYDIWIATRPSRADPFGAPIRIDAVNSPEDEADPCLSTDGNTLYFARGTVTMRKILRSTYTP